MSHKWKCRRLLFQLLEDKHNEVHTESKELLRSACAVWLSAPNGGSSACFVLHRAFESSMAETLHDLAKYSMDSVGVSGGGHATGSHSTTFSSSMFSSLLDLHMEPSEFMDTAAIRNKKK